MPKVGLRVGGVRLRRQTVGLEKTELPEIVQGNVQLFCHMTGREFLLIQLLVFSLLGSRAFFPSKVENNRSS